MKKQFHLAVAAAIAGSLAFASIGTSHASHARASHPNASTKPPKLKKGVTLKMADFWPAAKDTPERVYAEKLAAQFKAKYDITIDFLGSPSNQTQNMCTQGPSGSAPDVVGYPDDQLANMVGCKAAAEVPSWAWTPAEQKGDVKAALQGVTYKGKIYAIPYAIETTGIFYNKALIPASLWKPKKGDKYVRWSTVIAKAKSFGENKGIGWDITNLYHDYFAVSGNGGYAFKYVKGKGFEASKLGTNTPGFLKGIEWLYSLSNKGKYDLFTSSMSATVGGALFDAGKLPMFLTGPWDEAGMTAKGVKYGFAPDPSFDGKHPSRPFSGVQQFSVSNFSKNKTDAFAWISYMTKHLEPKLYEVNGRPPVQKSILNSKIVQHNAVGRAVAQAALAASPMPNIPEMSTLWTPFANNMTAMFQGKATPQQVASTTNSQVKAAIAKLHSGG